MSILSNLRHFIQQNHLIPSESRVVVGVSGGPDSLSLLHALNSLAADNGWYLHAAYLHHGLRPEADDEARFVAEVAAAWGLGCTIERADVLALAQQPGVSLEEAARQARYAFLGEVAVDLSANIIAIGHNADDQVETVLMHLLRGSGLAGLRGMLPKTALSGLHLPLIPPEQRPQNPELYLVRPWLQTSRAQILAYCQKNGLHPREDATNTDTTFFRNRLRHQVIPQLQRINPRLTRIIGHTAQALQGDYEALARHRASLWQELAYSGPTSVRFPLAAFRALPVGDQRALLRRAILHLRPDLRNINWEHSERLLTILQSDPRRCSGGPYTLVAGLQAWLNVDRLDISDKNQPVTDAPQIEHTQPLLLPGTLSLNAGWRLEARQVHWSSGELPPWQDAAKSDCVWLPLDIPAPLQVRPRQSGDRMAVFGLGGSKAISALMTELKLPRLGRPHWPLLVDAQGRILWLLRGRASELCRIPATATTAWEICLHPPAA